jgi:hypothetical protein
MIDLPKQAYTELDDGHDHEADIQPAADITDWLETKALQCPESEVSSVVLVQKFSRKPRGKRGENF